MRYALACVAVGVLLMGLGVWSRVHGPVVQAISALTQPSKTPIPGERWCVVKKVEDPFSPVREVKWSCEVLAVKDGWVQFRTPNMFDERFMATNTMELEYFVIKYPQCETNHSP